MALRFHNTLSQKVEEFAPADGRTVKMYTCGPTVWNYAHIGNFRTFTFVDILRRWLRAHDWKLDHVMNITDVDDRIIQQAMAAGKSLPEYTKAYTAAFLEDAAALRLERPEHLVNATDHIEDMAAAIKRLSERGYTYESEGSVYFRIASFPDYGKLSHIDVSGIRAGARVDTDRYDKENARDFALWKAPKPGEPFWNTEIGPGRPGWHIECSVMSMKYLGETLDIHGGGIDLTFPHHENEIAQSEALTGKPFARFWLHSEHLILESQTMSKSIGNVVTLRDLMAQGHAPETVRFVLTSVPYGKKLNFTMDSLKAAETAIERLRNFQLRLRTAVFPEGVNEDIARRTRESIQAFRDALDDDLNTAEALGVVYEYVREANTAMDAGQFRAGNSAGALELLERFDAIFDVLRPTAAAGGMPDAEVEALIAERNAARKARNFARSDEIRKQLAETGVILEDTKDGTRWKRA